LGSSFFAFDLEYVNIGQTTKDSEMANIRLFPVPELEWGLVVCAYKRCAIIDIYSKTNGERPETIRQASMMPHAFCFVYVGLLESLCMSVLLLRIWH